jgi:hypothetical protein
MIYVLASSGLFNLVVDVTSIGVQDCDMTYGG